MNDNRLAKLTADLFNQLQEGLITLEELESFVNHKPSFDYCFEHNQNGHVVFTVDGVDLTGEQEIDRFTRAGFIVSDDAVSLLTRKFHRSYDDCHRISDFGAYRAVLVPVSGSWDCELGSMELYKRYGYHKPHAALGLRVIELMSRDVMARLGCEYMIVPHKTLRDKEQKDARFFYRHKDDRHLTSFQGDILTCFMNKGLAVMAEESRGGVHYI